MQGASALGIGGLVCPLSRGGCALLPMMARVSALSRLLRLAEFWNPTATRRFVFDVLLLLAFPLLFTLQAFVELPEFAGSSHQFVRFIGCNLLRRGLFVRGHNFICFAPRFDERPFFGQHFERWGKLIEVNRLDIIHDIVDML